MSTDLGECQIAYSEKIAELRTKTVALYQKQQAGEFEKLEAVFMTFTVIAVITSLALLMLEFSFFTKQIGVILLALIIPGVFLILKTLLVKQGEMLFESYVLEIIRYEAEIEAMGLSSFYGQEDERTRDILSSLGFDTGAVMSLDRWPLESAE